MGDLTSEVQKFNRSDDPAAVKAFGGMVYAVQAPVASTPLRFSPLRQ